jgi:hypothetical protein
VRRTEAQVRGVLVGSDLLRQGQDAVSMHDIA